MNDTLPASLDAALAWAAADMAHRDDLARDVARIWVEEYKRSGRPVGVRLGAALDRLAAAYGEQQ